VNLFQPEIEETTIFKLHSLASRINRLLAALFDSLLFAPVLLLSLFKTASNVMLLTILSALWFLGIFIVQIILLTKSGQTVGKKLMKIKIVKICSEENGGFRSNVLLRGFVNALLFLIPFYPLIDLLFIFSDDRRCLHDRIAGTKVINM